VSKHSAHKLGLHICMKNNGRVRSVVRLNKIPFYNLLARHKQVPRAVGDCEARVVAGIHGLNYLADHVIMLVRCVCVCVCAGMMTALIICMRLTLHRVPCCKLGG